VVDINANGNGSSTPNDLLAWNGKLYFEADEPVLGSELYQYDPATDDLQVIDIAPGSADSGPRDLAIFNDKVFFTAFDPDMALRSVLTIPSPKNWKPIWWMALIRSRPSF
jgi:ELWxxDGT repeat protein